MKEALTGLICDNADVSGAIRANAVASAYAVALISTDDRNSITAPWVLKIILLRSALQDSCGNAIAADVIIAQVKETLKSIETLVRV